jgi:hypothetical protein
MQFGHRHLVNGKFPRRHAKGATTFSYFLRGFADGTVKLWDYRNTRNVSEPFDVYGSLCLSLSPSLSMKVVIKWEQKEAGRIVHTAFSGHELIALSAPYRSSNEPFLTFVEPPDGRW